MAQPRTSARWLRLLVPLALAASGAMAQNDQLFVGVDCFPSGTTTYTFTGVGPDRANSCGTLVCYPPLWHSVTLSKVPACNPFVGSCTVTITGQLEFPGTHQFDLAACGGACGGARANVWTPAGAVLDSCGTAGGQIIQDFGTLSLSRSASCSNPGTWFYPLEAVGCPDSTANCQRRTLEVADLGAFLGCRRPRPSGCGDEDGAGAGACCLGPGGGAPPFGGASPPPALRGAADSQPGPMGLGLRIPRAAPDGIELIFQADAAGTLGMPEVAGWIDPFGLYWNHTFSRRIVRAPNDAHVWMISPAGTYREFTDGNADGTYEIAVPADEYRTLTKTAGGWELRDLAGLVHQFDNGGLWSATVDRNGVTIAGVYLSGRLDRVDFPDSRQVQFTYDFTGRVSLLTEIGVGGSPSRVWAYTHAAGLSRVSRPDGTAASFAYGTGSQIGLLTLWNELPTSPGFRVAGAWSYDASRRLTRAWRGDVAFTGANAVGKIEWAYPSATSTTVTHTLQGATTETSTYQYEWDAPSGKPRITSIQGDCPTCGLGPNTQLQYGDSSNPFRPTRSIDGKGHITDFGYDAFGMVTSQTEAVGTALERTTTRAYHATYPALVESVIRPSTSGALAERETSFSFDAFGNPTTRTETGMEAGGAFAYATTTTFNAAGQPLVHDSPGHGTADQTSTTYDATRGNLVPLTRTNPIGTMTYAYDGFNRRTSSTDPNGVVTETVFDALDRPTTVTVRGAVVAEDLVTRYFYNVFKDPFCTVLPRGNAIENLYDTAGRMLTTAHGTAVASPSASSCLNTALPRERTRYTLNGQGQRTREDREVSTGTTTWASRAATAYVYSTRCHLDQIVQAPGTPEEAVTEHAYDCDGNMARTWDPNHPSAGQTNPPTTEYDYDALERLTTMTQPWGGAGGGTAVTTYSYDVQDHLTAVTDGEGSLTSYAYSDRDLMTSELSPVSGTTSHGYDEHGEHVTTTDARDVTMNRTLDPADRVTLADYPGTELDTTYTYGINAAAFSIGRLTGVTRPNGTAVTYTFDRFGRALSDGELTFLYDKNGNRTTIGYPGNTVASYTYDFADRPATLTATPPGAGAQTVASAAAYLPRGPLSAVTLGNGAVETRSFDGRYAPTAIQVSGNRLTWNYLTDDVGNPTAISQTQPAAESRSYGYQDFQYFLTSGVGPWGSLGWTYDRIGNRLSETRDALSDSYQYVPNTALPTPGHTALLDQITLGVGGTRDYTFGPAGHLDRIDSGALTTDYGHTAEGQLGAITSPSAQPVMTYDGRSFLRQAEQPASTIFQDGFDSGDLTCWGATTGGDDLAAARGGATCFTPSTAVSTTSTYGSEGRLYSIRRETGERSHVLYFSGRPVAQVKVPAAGAASFTYLTADHLGTPVLALNQAGATLWRGGFEPFGTDWQAGTASGASENGLFLRFPGQWVDGVWGTGEIYNVHRWYQPQQGSYTRPDPMQLRLSQPTDYVYVLANPVLSADPLGLFKVEYILRPYDEVRRRCGGGALGCTQTDVKYHCRCRKDGCDWAPSLLFGMVEPLQIVIGADCYDPELTKREEMKHVRAFESDYSDAMEVARSFRSKRFQTESECMDACERFAGDQLRAAIRPAWKHALIDFSHPSRRCDGSIKW